MHPNHCAFFVERTSFLSAEGLSDSRQLERTGAIIAQVWSNEWSEGAADPVSVHFALALDGLLSVCWPECSIPMARVPAWDPQLLWYTVAMVGSLLVGAAVVALVERWRKKRLMREAEPADELARY